MKKYLLNITQTLLVLVALLATGVASARNFSFSVPEVSIVKGEVAEIPVWFESDVEVTSLMVDVKIPTDLTDLIEFAPATDAASLVTWNESRITDQRFTSLNSAKVTGYTGNSVIRAAALNSTKDGGILPSGDDDASKVLFTFRVQLKADQTFSDKNWKDLNFFDFISVSVDVRGKDNIEGSVSDDTKAIGENSEITVSPAESVKTLNDPEYVGKLSFDAESYLIVPGATQTIGVNYDSDYDAHSLSFVVALPEGLKLDTDADTWTFSSRAIGLNCKISAQAANPNNYTVLFSTTSTTPSVTKGEGQIMTFNVVADSTFVTNANTKISVSVIRGSELDATFPIKSDDFSVAVDNGEATRLAENTALWQADIAAINGLTRVVEEALEEVAEYIFGREDSVEASWQAKLDALTDAANAEIDRVTKVGTGAYQPQVDEEAFSQSVSEYVEAIKKYGLSAVEDEDALKAAQDAVKEAKDDVETAVKAVPEAVAESEGVSAAITAANQAVTDFGKAVSAGGDAAALNAVVEDGKAAVAAAIANIQKAVNNEAINSDRDLLDKLGEKLSDAEEAAGEFGDQEAADEIAELIKNYQDSVDQAAADVADGSGAYISPSDMMEEEIAEKIEDYQAAAAEAAAVSLRNNNQVAYNADLKAIAQVEAAYQQALELINANNSEALNDATVAAANQRVIDAIAAAKQSASDELTTANENLTTYDNEFNASLITVLITDLQNKAAAAGVAVITVDTVVEGAIYTLDGVRHNYPVQGKINIIRTNDSSIKVFVK